MSEVDLEEKVKRMVRERMSEAEEIIDQLIRQKQEEIIEEKIREELSKDIFKNSELMTEDYAQ